MNDDLTSASVAEPKVETRPATESSVRQETHTVNSNGQGTKKSTATERPVKGPPKSVWREYFESAVVTVIMALFGMTFIVQAVKVPTGSMQNTIIVGDHLLVNKFIFAPGPPLPFLPMREIERGDIIVFKYPGNKIDPRRDEIDPNNTPYKTNYVKRVVGLPGDKIEVRDNQVLINGQPLPEHRVTVAAVKNEKAPLVPENEPPRKPDELYSVYYYRDTSAADSSFHFAVNGEPYTVPAASYFVMGDSRDNSSDSRAWGVVPRQLVIGRAMFVYWSYDESAPQSEGIIGKIEDFFTNTRWDRTGTMVK
jgi:signal peptidase I